MQEQRIYSINQMMAAYISMTLTETSEDDTWQNWINN